MKSNWIGGVAAAALLVAGAASAQTMGNGPATTSTPGNPNATTSSPDTPGNTGTVPIGNGSMGTGSTAAGTTTAPMPGTADNGPATTSGNGSMVNGGVGNSNGAVNTTSQNQSQPARGANSFTQGEARSRLQARGYQNASNLHEDANGVWRGQATHEGQQVSVWLDYKGNVGQGGPGQVTGQQANQYLLTQQRQQEPNMATRTIARLYATYNDAAAVVDDLQSSGIPQTDISIVRQGAHTVDTTTATGESGAGVGATVGTLLGGGAGLLAGLGTIAIPGVGPIVAAGWLIAMLTGAGVGAAAGGILGALTGAGVDREEAVAYDEGVRRGGTLVSVRASDADLPRVEAIIARRSPVDWRGYSAGTFPAAFGDTRPVEPVGVVDENRRRIG